MPPEKTWRRRVPTLVSPRSSASTPPERMQPSSTCCTAVGDRFAVVAPELPGHGTRRGEPLLTNMSAVVACIVKDHGDTMTGRYALLGVSFGALVAFEVSKHMQGIGRGCAHLLVASEAAPGCVTPDVDPCLPDDAMVREMSARGWLPSEIVEGGPEVWSVVLPAFKADLGCEAAYASAAPSAGHDHLRCPVTVLVGDEDQELFVDGCARVQPWEDVSVGGAKRITVVGGGHLFVEDVAGCNAIVNAAGGDGAEGASVSLVVRGATWELFGDDGLVPPLVLEGIGITFVALANAILEGVQAPLHEVVPRQMTARPIADPTPLDQRLLHDEFVSNERNRPASTAVVDLGTGKTITYKDFGRMSLLVAAELRRAGVGNADTVAIVAKKGFQQLIGAVRRALGRRTSPDVTVHPCNRAATPLIPSPHPPLPLWQVACLRASAAYMPVNSKQMPRERVEQLIELSKAAAIVADDWTLETMPWIQDFGLPVLQVRDSLLAEGNEAFKAASKTLKSVERAVERACAYVIYTSGSTGTPKGVRCHHQGAMNTIVSLNEFFDVGPKDRVLALSSLSFDLSIYDLFGMGAAGGAIIVPAAEDVNPPNPDAWLSAVAEHQVTLINAVPAFVELLVGHCEATGARLPACLRMVWMSGDWVPLSLPGRVRALSLGNITVVSMGGATEAAVWSNIHIVDRLLPDWKSIPYGRPLGNQTMYVLDESSANLEHCAPWVTGMIYIGGAGVALGYSGDAQKTAKSFFCHPMTVRRKCLDRYVVVLCSPQFSARTTHDPSLLLLFY